MLTHVVSSWWHCVSTMKPDQNGWCFADTILKFCRIKGVSLLWSVNLTISCISSGNGLAPNRWQAIKPWSLMHMIYTCITRPQWVKISHKLDKKIKILHSWRGRVSCFIKKRQHLLRLWSLPFDIQSIQTDVNWMIPQPTCLPPPVDYLLRFFPLLPSRYFMCSPLSSEMKWNAQV